MALRANLEAHAYAAMRIVTGFLFLFHGLQKLFGMFGGQVVELTSPRGAAGVIEFARSAPAPHAVRCRGDARRARWNDVFQRTETVG